MAGEIFGDNPVAIAAVEAFWGDGKPGPDRFIRVGDTAGIRAPDESFDQGRDLDSLLLADLEIPDNIDGGTRRDEGDPVNFLL